MSKFIAAAAAGVFAAAFSVASIAVAAGEADQPPAAPAAPAAPATGGDPAAAAAPAAVAPISPAVQMLFESKHITAVAPGTELVYKFERKPSDPKVLGLGFTDDISVKIESDAAEGKKNVLVQIYSGERARDPQRITDMDGNPMLVVFLDGAVAHFRELAGGDRDYLKNTMKKDLGKTGKLEPATIVYKGAPVEGFRVTVTPFANDPARAKMRGFEGARFSIFISEKIPGYFAKMVSEYRNSDKTAPMLEEVTTLDGVGDAK